MQVAVKKDINVTVKTLQETAEDQIEFKVSYGKARRAKEDIFQRQGLPPPAAVACSTCRLASVPSRYFCHLH
jgi:hypothetical protein